MYSAALKRNPVRTRADLQQVMLELWRPLRTHLERDGAAVTLEINAATYGEPAARMETFVRPLWGVASLAAGGAAFADGDLVRSVLAEGIDPAHPHYWGDLRDHDQRAVEMGSLAAALWISPELLWKPLPAKSRAHLVAWLGQINRRKLWDNNWRFFRVLVNGALRAVGEQSDEAQVRADLARLDSFYRSGGWYGDGVDSHFDYYIPMAMHLSGLLYARLAGPDAPLAADFCARARWFAPGFAAWFAPNGAALPLGRSLTYRFAQGAFWGALAFAEVETIPWGVIKGLHLRHLRWWLQQPIFTESGLLTVGYGYPNQIMAEGYNAPGSPYWAAKAFLPLALPDDHPFWTADEAPCEVAPIVASPARPGLVVCRDAARGHVFALTNNPPHPSGHRHTGPKYAKFVYSTAFAFDVPVGGVGPRQGASDSMLLVSDDGRDWRAREAFVALAATADTLHSRWSPWPDVEIDTWLAPALPGHVRVHRIKSARRLQVCEGGFPIERTRTVKGFFGIAGEAAAENGEAFSAVWDLAGKRKPVVFSPEPNTNLLHPLTLLPTLESTIEPGETWLFTAVAGLPGSGQEAAAREWRAELSAQQSGPPAVLQRKTVVLECRDEE